MTVRITKATRDAHLERVEQRHGWSLHCHVSSPLRRRNQKHQGPSVPVLEPQEHEKEMQQNHGRRGEEHEPERRQIEGSKCECRTAHRSGAAQAAGRGDRGVEPA